MRLMGRSMMYLAVLLIICGDALALTGALLLSLQLRFDSTPFSQVCREYVMNNAPSLAIALGALYYNFHCIRLYRYAWRFASL